MPSIKGRGVQLTIWNSHLTVFCTVSPANRHSRFFKTLYTINGALNTQTHTHRHTHTHKHTHTRTHARARTLARTHAPIHPPPPHTPPTHTPPPPPPLPPPPKIRIFFFLSYSVFYLLPNKTCFENSVGFLYLKYGATYVTRYRAVTRYFTKYHVRHITYLILH